MGVAAYALRTVVSLPAPVVRFFDDWLYDGLLLGAGLLCAAAAFSGARRRSGWAFLGAGMILWAAGDIYYTHWLATDPSPPYPSLADAGYLGLFPLAYAGFLLLIKERVPKLTPGVWLDGATAGFAVAALSAAVVVEAVLNTSTGDTAAVATNLAYPLADGLLVAIVVGAFSLTGWRPGRAWLVLGAGLAVMAAADSIYLYQIAKDTYVGGTILDAAWPAAMVLLANAAWVSHAHDRPVDAEGRSFLVVPATCAVAGIGVLVLDHFDRLNALALALAIATLASVVARLGLTFRENRRLFELVRTDAVTDMLTGLGNRRRLMTDLADVFRGDADGSWLLVIFDLDGFKGYNDTFGHPAGDVLLHQFGTRLGRVPIHGGGAYRLGGDEFCLLAPIREVSVETLLDAATSALSAHGDGFQVDASFGAVFLPDDATDARGALVEADARLYAHKHQKRSRRERAHEVLLQALHEREPDLRGHNHGVAELAVEVGRRLGLDAPALELLERSAQLHDIGKIAVPDQILHKPGPLSDDEWAFVRQHTLVGQRILAVSPALRPIGEVVRSTHERWDGTGYPDGLAGEQIPLAARIIAVCDAYDAMTSARPYREALDSSTALIELHRCAGSQFDPTVVALVADCVQQRRLAA